MSDVTAEHSATTHHDDDKQAQSCQICGMPGTTNDGLCGLCLDLPCCRSCLRKLPEVFFIDEPDLCVVSSHFQLYTQNFVHHKIW